MLLLSALPTYQPVKAMALFNIGKLLFSTQAQTIAASLKQFKSCLTTPLVQPSLHCLTVVTFI